MPQGKCSQSNRARRAGLRLRRGLGLAPRAVVLMSCSCALALAAVAGYGATLPGMVEAREERMPHIAHKGESSLGGTTGYVWARVLDSTLFAPSDSTDADASASEVKLEDGTTILISSIKGASALSANSVTRIISDAEQRVDASQGQGFSANGSKTDRPGASSSAADNQGSSSKGDSGSTGGSGSASDGGTGGDSSSGDTRPRPSAETESSIHAWLVAKANALDGYVSRVNAAVSTYNATGDASACDSLANELFYMRGEFGRQTFPTNSIWYGQFGNLWGAYTHLDIYVGHYGDDAAALATFNEKVAAIAL